MAHAKNRNSGFTLVELLVVIAIIAILVFLLMPAVQAAREAARTTQCRNNMKQVATGIINYESAFGRLPTAGHVNRNRRPTYAFGEFNPKLGLQISWTVLILPYVEEQALYEKIDLNRSIFEQDGDPQKQHVVTYQCPSDDASGQFYEYTDSAQSDPIEFAKGNYAAYVSPIHTDLLMPFPGGLGGGKWVPGPTRRIQRRIGQKSVSVTDGLSKTIVLSEVRVLDDTRDQRGAWALPWTGSSLLALDVHHDPFSDDRYSPVDESLPTAQIPNQQSENQDMLYDCFDPEYALEKFMPCATWESGRGMERPGDNHYLSAAPRSNHPGGVVAAQLDGSVLFLPDSVDARTLAFRICSIDGKEAELSQLQ